MRYRGHDRGYRYRRLRPARRHPVGVDEALGGNSMGKRRGAGGAIDPNASCVHKQQPEM